jgi:hypothetical protein
LSCFVLSCTTTVHAHDLPPPPLLGTLKTTKNGSKSSSFVTSAVSLSLARALATTLALPCLALSCLVLSCLVVSIVIGMSSLTLTLTLTLILTLTLTLILTLTLPYTNLDPKMTTWMKWIRAVRSVLYWIRSTNASVYS